MPKTDSPYDPFVTWRFVEAIRMNKNMSDDKVIERLIRMGIADKEILKDPAAVKALAEKYNNFYGHLDPHNMKDKIVLLNSKIMTDYMEWYRRHFGRPFVP